MLEEGDIRAKAHNRKEPGRDPREGVRGRATGDGFTLYRTYKATWEDVFITGTMGSSGEF